MSNNLGQAIGGRALRPHVWAKRCRLARLGAMPAARTGYGAGATTT